MSSFLPSCASPQASPKHRPRGGIPNLSSLDITISSATSSASVALSGLSAMDVRLIDEIIERSSPSATTFLTVFKAYNEVLHEHGMDAANDVVYYKILLKLGVVKGHDWGAKWETVKEQLGYGDGNEKEAALLPRSARVARRGGLRVERSEPRRPLPSLVAHRVGLSRMPLSRPPLSTYRRDSVTVHSHQDDGSEATETETETQTETEMEEAQEQEATDNGDFSSSPTTLIPRERASVSKENALHLSTGPSSYPPLPSIDQFLPVQAKKLHSDYHATSEYPSELRARITPPPYKLPSVKKSSQLARPADPVRVPRMQPSSVPNKSSLLRGNSLNDEDTWKKVKMIRDEKEADKFREVMLLERCWKVWKGGLHWLITMSEKVEEERGKALLYSHLQKWRSRLERRQKEYHQIGQKHDIHLLNSSLIIWKRRLRTKQVTRWKDDMRRTMTIVRTKRDYRVREEAWIKWRQLHHGEVADLHYEQRLVSRVFGEWKTQISKIDHMEAAADEFSQMLERNQTARMWDFWKRQASFCETEKVIRNRIDARLMDMVLQAWKEKMSENHEADVFHDLHIIKNFFQRWKRSLSRLRALEHKANKYQNRQDGVLLRAVLHVWATRERGALMDRAMKSRSQRNVWVVWKSRVSELRAAEGLAIEFRRRPSSALASAALGCWRKALVTRRSLHGQAVRYDEDLLKHRILLVWRVQLRFKLKMVKHAKVARKYLLMRQIWNKWRDRLEEQKRQQRLHVLQLKILQKFFERWRSSAASQQYHKLALQRVEAMASARILSDALRAWTNRVIALKLRELEVVERRDHNNIISCFDRWKAVFKRHAEDLRLMQSYQYVKREEIMRRMFSRWLSAAKTIRHRRLLLQEREEDMKLTVVEKAWDQWRERFRAERLRPLEYTINTQFQKNRLYQAYLFWHSKTKSVPAINFFSSRTKAKVWRVWREAMPKAFQSREARKRDQEKLLGRALDKWAQAYRTKIALKAVARARYLRLPSGAPRQSLPLSSALSGILRGSSQTSSKTTHAVSLSVDGRSDRGTVAHEDDVTSNAASSAARKRPLALRPAKLAFSRLSVGSSASQAKNTDLWHELRRAQRRSPSERRDI